jgi:threonine/homoserine/homoserine lactone efflux protein
MPDTATLVTFSLIVVGLIVVPGPAVILTLARSMSGGRRVGIATCLGIAVGDLIHTLFAAVGLSAILMTSALAFEVVKYLGVGYLVYLGIRALLDRGGGLDVPAARRIGAAAAFRQAVLAEMLNPKTALFFLAFLPQFLQPQAGSAVLQLTVLGVIVVVIGAAYTLLLAFSAGALAGWLARNPGFGRWQGKLVGCVYLSLGARLALEER